MTRLVNGLAGIFLCFFLTSALADVQLNLKAADGTIIKAKVLANNEIISENGSPLPNGLYVNADYSTIHVINGKIISYTQKPASNSAASNATLNPQTQQATSQSMNPTMQPMQPSSVNPNNPTYPQNQYVAPSSPSVPQSMPSTTVPSSMPMKPINTQQPLNPTTNPLMNSPQPVRTP